MPQPASVCGMVSELTTARRAHITGRPSGKGLNRGNARSPHKQSAHRAVQRSMLPMASGMACDAVLLPLRTSQTLTVA